MLGVHASSLQEVRAMGSVIVPDGREGGGNIEYTSHVVACSSENSAYELFSSVLTNSDLERFLLTNGKYHLCGQF